MNRVKATIFATSEPVARETLAKIVGKNCSIDLLIDDIREELRGRPYDLAAVAGADCEGAAARDLYQPLVDRLQADQATLRKLSFSASRHADVKQWASVEEKLFDLRRAGDFKRKGSLAQWANANLRKAWEIGDVAAIDAAIQHFTYAWQGELLDVANVAANDQAGYRNWLMRFAKWLFQHRSHPDLLQHRLRRHRHDKALARSSRYCPAPLCLALDKCDHSPLIIDQPEENLDPKSIFDALLIVPKLGDEEAMYLVKVNPIRFDILDIP